MEFMESEGRARNEVIKYLGDGSLVNRFFQLLPDSGREQCNRESLANLMTSVIDDLERLEKYFIESEPVATGMMESVLLAIGIARQHDADFERNSPSSWVLLDEIPDKKVAKSSLRLLASRVDIYSQTGCVDLFDWLDVGVVDEVIVIPMGHNVVRVRSIGNVGFGDVQRAMANFENEQLAEFIENRFKPFDGPTFVVIEDYNDLGYDQDSRRSDSSSIAHWDIDAATSLIGTGYRVNDRLHIAIGTFPNSAAQTEFMVSPQSPNPDRFFWLTDKRIGLRLDATETQKKLGRLEAAYSMALKKVNPSKY